MSLDMPSELRWLSYLAGSAWPEGDEDKMFALGEDYQTAANTLNGLLDLVHTACNTASDNYSGDGADKMKKQFEQFFTGDQSVPKLVESLKQLGKSAHDMGAEIEHTKWQVIITLAILAAEIAYALTTWFGAVVIPALQAETAGVMAGIGRAMAMRLQFLVEHANAIAAMPLWKLAAISGVTQGVLGLVTEVAVEDIQKKKGHIDGFDLKRIFIAGAVGGVSGAVAAPLGSVIGKGLGNWVGKYSTTWWGSAGIAVGAGTTAGLVGNLAGFVTGGALTGEWEFDPAMLAGVGFGGIIGGVHGAIGHARAKAMDTESFKSAASSSTDLKIADGSAIHPAPAGKDGAGGRGMVGGHSVDNAGTEKETRTVSRAVGTDRSTGPGSARTENNSRSGPQSGLDKVTAPTRSSSVRTGSIAAASVLRPRAGSVGSIGNDGSVSHVSAASTPNGNSGHRSASAPPPVTRGFGAKPEPASGSTFRASSPEPQGSRNGGVTRNGGSVGAETHSSSASGSRHSGEFTAAESHARPSGELDARSPAAHASGEVDSRSPATHASGEFDARSHVSDGSESHGSIRHEPAPDQVESRPSSRASSVDGTMDSQSRGRTADGVSSNGSRVGSETPTRTNTPEPEAIRRSASPTPSAASDGGSHTRITAAHNESGPAVQRPAVARADQPSGSSSRAASPERAVGPAGGPRPEGPAGHSGPGSDGPARTNSRNSGDDARTHPETGAPERKHSTDEPEDRSIRRPRTHLPETKDGPALSEQPPLRAADLPTDSLGVTYERLRATEAYDDLGLPIRQAAEEPVNPHEVKLRDQLRTEVAAGDQNVIGTRERLNAAAKELDDSSRALESVRAEKDRESGAADAAAHAESRHEAARAAHDAAKAEHDAAVEHAVQERYAELKADSEIEVLRANQDRLFMLEGTDAQTDISVKNLRKEIADLKNLRKLHEMEKAQLEVSLNHTLDENIRASKDKVAKARETFENSKKEYEEARSGNEPRAEYLKQLNREVKQSRKNLRDEMIEHEALLTAAKDRTEELAAARNDRAELASDRRRRWVFNRRVEQRSEVWERTLSRRESDETAQSRVAELGKELAAKEAAHPEAVAKFKREMHEVLEKRFAGLGTAKVPDLNAYEKGLAGQREAMSAASKKAMEMGDAVVKAAFVYRDEVLRHTEETDAVIGRGASDAELDRMVRHGSRAEQVAAMAEWMTRHDPNPDPAKRRTPRRTQMLAYVLTEFGPADMKGGEGKTLVMVMSGYRDAMKHGAETILTSSEPLVLDMMKEIQGYLGTHEEHRAGLKDMGVDMVQLRENEPFPQWAWDAKASGRNLLVVGTKEAVLFIGLHEANSMIEEIGRAGAPKEVVAEVKEWLRTEPHIDAVADRLNAMAEEQKIARRFKPLPEAKVNLDEIDTAFDGEVRAKLSPGADGDASPATVTQLKDLYEKFRLAMLDLPENPLTDKDFGRPENTSGLWHARMTEDAINKLTAVTGDRGSVLANAEHYTKFANVKWGLQRDTHFNTSRKYDKVMQMNASTTDRLMWEKINQPKCGWRDWDNISTSSRV